MAKYSSQGYVCNVLSPLKGIRALSNATSENVQFTGSTYNVSACIDYLKRNKVCDFQNIFEYISVVGISPRTDYKVTNYLKTDADPPHNKSYDVYSTENSLASSIQMILPDGSLVISTSNLQQDVRVKTELLYGVTASFPIPDPPTLDIHLLKNKVYIFKEGKIYNQVQLVNQNGRCRYPNDVKNKECFGPYRLALDLFDNSLWAQESGVVSMFRIDTSTRTKPMRSRRFNTAPYANPKGSSFAVYNGTVWMINFRGNTDAYGSQNMTFGTAPYSAGIDDAVINQYYANPYYALSSLSPQLVQMEMSTGKTQLYDLWHSCPTTPMNVNARYSIYYDYKDSIVSVLQSCMNQPSSGRSESVSYVYGYYVKNGRLKPCFSYKPDGSFLTFGM